MNRARSLLTVISPLSLESWYHQFCGTMTSVAFVGEGGDNIIKLADHLCTLTTGHRIRILSSHDSLLRDWALAQELQTRGFTVNSQSGMAASAALDKVLQKQLLSFAGIPTPSWGLSKGGPPPGIRAIWKGRTSTQSRGTRWCTPSEGPPDDSYWEMYVEGVEYSAVLYRENRQSLHFPIVWKGAVRADLSPPWRRLRLVPCGAPAVQIEKMHAFASRIAEILDISGFVEVEYIVTRNGDPLVIDINPRICGTMRIVAMATGTQIFDQSALPAAAELPAIRFAAEAPYSGPAITAPELVATSRMTCSGESAHDVFGMLTQYGIQPNPKSLPQVWRAD